jgi:hypothetical protein
MAARPPAPIKGEGERRITLDRHRGGALQLLKIVGLFALESPGIEGLRERLGARSLWRTAARRLGLAGASVEQAQNRSGGGVAAPTVKSFIAAS